MHRLFVRCTNHRITTPIAMTSAMLALQTKPSKDVENCPSHLNNVIARNHVAYKFPNFKCSVVSFGSNRPNQDQFIAANHVVGVADGHGDLGHHVSTLVKHSLESGARNPETSTEALKHCEHTLIQEVTSLDLEQFPQLLQESEIARKSVLKAHSGSTVCIGTPDEASATTNVTTPVTLGQNKKWWTFANLGDSQAYYIDLANNLTLPLTKPETVQDPLEQRRLFQAHKGEEQKHLYQRGSYILGRVQPTSVIGDFHLKQRLSQVKQFFDPVVGKNNTHVMGYYLTPPYLRHEPTISRFQLDINQDTFIVFGTDGFWDRVSPDEVKQKLQEPHSPQVSPAAHLAALALQKPFLKNNPHSSSGDWNIIKSCFSKNVRDDITIVVITA
jgi:serine/threonine protein phosphatase PrpC